MCLGPQAVELVDATMIALARKIDMFNMLLEVLDSGQLTDGQGRRVDFR